MFNSNKSSIIIAGLLILAFACIGHAETKYYRHILINDPNIALRYPIDPINAENVNCYRIEYGKNAKIIKIEYQKNNKPAIGPDADFAYLLITYDNDKQHWKFFDANNKPIFGDTGAYEIIYNIDIKGRLISKINLNKNGKIVEDSSGTAEYIFKADETGNVIISLRTNLKGDTIIDNNGIYQQHYKYDKIGNLIEESNYDKLNNLLENTNGYAICRYKYDGMGNIVETATYDSNDRPKVDKFSGGAVLKFDYDNNGNIIESKSFDQMGMVASSGGINFPILRAYYDDNNNLKKFDYCNASGRVEEKIKFDVDGNLIEESYYDVKGNLKVNQNEGFAKFQAIYENGILTEMRYSDSNEKLMNKKDTGIARIVVKHDAAGRLVEKICYDKDGNIKTCADKEGE